MISLATAQNAPSFEARKTSAYQKFHHGEVREAAKEIRVLASEASDDVTKGRLLRDLTEICATAVEAGCVLEAQAEAFQLAQKNDALKDIIPDLYSYFIRAQTYVGNKESLREIFKNDKLNFYSPGINPPAAALAHLTASAYFVAGNKYSLAEAEYSIAVMCLLLTDTKNQYAISKTLVEMLGVLISQQDIVGALRLIRVADSYLSANLNHAGPIWAQYMYLATDLLAITKRHKDIVPALAEAARLNERQDINDGVKLYRVGTSNDLQTVALLFDGKDKEATETHARHPLQARRELIIQRGHLESLQELFFVVSDVVVHNINGSKREEEWKPLLLAEFPAVWQLTSLQTKNIDSYRQFALGVIESNHSKSAAAQLYQLGARERIDVFEEVLKQKSEGFQLPTVMDSLVVRTALASLADFPGSDQFDLMLRGSEVLLRTLRHQLSDFSVLIGSQQSERARASARSYNLLQQQKRDWEFGEIENLLKGAARNVGALINTYSHLVASVAQLKERFALNRDYVDTIGYPDIKQVQSILHEDEQFVTYVPTFRGLGRLCIAKDGAVNSFSDLDTEKLAIDVKLMKAALTADYAADDALDSQFPAAAAVRIQRVLFEGLNQCMRKGSHINIALPDEIVGIPLAALLAELPRPLGEGLDLVTAQWLGDEFTFSTFVSARHFLGTHRSLTHKEAPQSYLGIGNPQLSKAKTLGLERNGTINQIELRASALRGLTDLPETADELHAAQRLFRAEKSEVLLGAAASEEAFRSKDLGKYDVIHFATHGLLGGDLEGLTEPALVLTPVDQTDSFDDGLLTTSEITRFTLNARLIVLSACNTAKIDTNAASVGATDLQAAFAVAGAPTLVASLWTVETATARDIIVEFFNSWRKQTSKSASLALAIATRRYLKAADRAHQHPRFWAPFVVLGYGYAIDVDRTAEIFDTENFEAVEESGGEIIDAKVFQDKLVVSMQGDWDGRTMASIVKEPFGASDRAIAKSHEIGAGHLVVGGKSLYAIGYRASERPFPILRKLEPSGRVAWERHFEELVSYMFVDGRYVDGSLLLLAEPLANANEQEQRIVILKLNLDGKELNRREVRAPAANLLIGRKSIFANLSSGLGLAINSQSPSGLDFDPARIGPLGLPPFCKGSLQATIYSVDLHSLVETKLSVIDNYQVSTVDRVGSRTIVAGHNRERCSDDTRARLIEFMADNSHKTVWTDEDPFPSSVQSFTELADGLAVLVRRQRPLGVRFVAQKAGATESKRWGDDGVELWEFSVIKIAFNGRLLGIYDSTFGISSYAQGIIRWQNKPTIFGSLGGRPAISSPSTWVAVRN
jgi:CHAT domain-containing protein